MGLVTYCERCKGETRPYSGYGEQPCRRCLQADITRLRDIADAAWEVRREQSDYNPCPDLMLRMDLRDRLNKLLDAWKQEQTP